MSAPSSHALYEGWVQHARAQPLEHAFRYPINFYYVDLDELDSAFRGRWFWSAHRAAPIWLRREDHLGDPRISLADAVRQLVSERGLGEIGPVRLLTQPRYFGFVMNPVSFYFCFDNSGEQLRAVVAEVHNTPWGEEHCYVLPAAQAETWLEKEFHVSPFMPMELRYRFELSAPAESLAVRIENYRGEELIFAANLQLRRRPWTTWQLHRAFWRYPLMAQRIFIGIYWQALRLWWKGAAYHPHPGGLRSVVTSPLNSPAEKLVCSDRG